MKNIFLYSLLFLAFASCQEDVKFNNPAFEAQKDNVFWRAVDSRASISDTGILTIEAYTRNEKVTLKTSSSLEGTYILGENTTEMVTYTLTETSGTTTFSTGTDIGNGQIVITEYDEVNKTITGTFKFNAINSDATTLEGATLNFQYGIFYKVPISKLVL